MSLNRRLSRLESSAPAAEHPQAPPFTLEDFHQEEDPVRLVGMFDEMRAYWDAQPKPPPASEEWQDKRGALSTRQKGAFLDLIVEEGADVDEAYARVSQAEENR